MIRRKKLSKKKMLSILQSKKFYAKQQSNGTSSGSFEIKNESTITYVTFTIRGNDVDSININMVPRKRR